MLAALASSLQARAQTPPEPTSTTYDYSPYEQDTIRLAERSLASRIDPHPEGKIVESVEFVTLDVIEPRDPVPGFLNVLHATSRRWVIEREVLVHNGDRYKKILVDETARNLRVLPQLSLVLCVPLQGRSPNQVVLAVITKDIWSLRLNWTAAYSSGGLESLVVNPSETNLFGAHQSVGARLEVQPESLAYGLSYYVPRLTSSRLRTLAAANVVFSRRSGTAEGTFGGFSVGRPLLTTRTEWAWDAEFSWRSDVYRRYVNAQLGRYDAIVTPQPDGIPYQYSTRRFLSGASVTRSFGWASKTDVTVGLQHDFRRYDAPSLDGFDPAAMQEFRDKRVPRDDIRLGPFAQARSYTTNYLRVLDFETLGLQEDIRLGHDLIARVYPVSAAIGSSRTFLGTFAAAQYTFPLGDGLLRIGVDATQEVEQGRVSDASITGFVRVVTPRLAIGRIVADSALLLRYRNYLNRSSLLGGNGRLRGYPSNYDVGRNLAVHNLEFRTRPLSLLSLQLGGALFYDVGDAFDAWSSLRVKESVGVGVRALFPQLDRMVFRGDLGFPVSRGRLPSDVAPVSFYMSFGQAFDLPSVQAP